MKNTRNTIQRSLVLCTVQKHNDHPTAEEIYQDIVISHPNISKGTVYRNLNLLSEKGQVRRIEIPNSADRFDHTLNPHYHIQCTHCGKVADVDMDYIENLAQKIKNTHGFLIDRHDIIFRGICPQCNK